MDIKSRYSGCLLGLAVGDAIGTTLEFQQRGTFEPLTDMVGGGPFDLAPGQWTDDTSMALCLAASLIEKQGFDAADQMHKYQQWLESGYMSSIGKCFDIGNTVSAALRSYRSSDDPYSGSTDPRSAGNGSIMRLAPVPMFFGNDLAAAQHWAVESSKTTHGTQECLDACWLLATILVHALNGAAKEELLADHNENALLCEKIVAIAAGNYKQKEAAEIRGTGYVVESLEAALWCFHTTDNFRDAILKAANLGDDADTTAAICGQVAGAHYGIESIPEEWRNQLARYAEIEDLASQLQQ